MHHALGLVGETVKKKPRVYLFVALLYSLIVAVVKWGIPQFTFMYFALGSIVGIYLLDLAQTFFAVYPSPFRTVFFMVGYSIVASFVVTSTNSMFGSGMILNVLLTMMLWQIGEYRMTGTIHSWFRGIATRYEKNVELAVFWGFLLFGCIVTLLFVRS